jgi:hypothetical protein
MSALLPVYPRSATGAGAGRGLLAVHTRRSAHPRPVRRARRVPVGARPPRADRGAHRQAYRTLDFYSNSLHLPMQERAAQAVLGGSAHLSHVHFVSSGTEANESAIHLARRLTGRETVVTLATELSRAHARLAVGDRAAGLPQAGAAQGAGALEPLIRSTIPRRSRRSTSSVAGVLIESRAEPRGHSCARPGRGCGRSRIGPRGGRLVRCSTRCRVGSGGSGAGTRTRRSACARHGHAGQELGGGFPVSAMVVTTPDIAATVTYSELGTTFGGGPMAAAMIEAVARGSCVRDDLMSRVRHCFERGFKSASRACPGSRCAAWAALIGVADAAEGQLSCAIACSPHDILVGHERRAPHPATAASLRGERRARSTAFVGDCPRCSHDLIPTAPDPARPTSTMPP